MVVNYFLLVGVLTLVWVLYAALRLAPLLMKRWKAWGEVCAFLVFTVIELGLIFVFLRP